MFKMKDLVTSTTHGVAQEGDKDDSRKEEHFKVSRLQYDDPFTALKICDLHPLPSVRC